MTPNRDHLIRKPTLRKGKAGLEQTHVWARADEGVSHARRGAMRTGLDQQAALNEGGGFGDIPPTSPVSSGGPGPSPAARRVFGAAADSLASRAIPQVSYGPQKRSLTVQGPSVSKAMTALRDFSHVNTPFAADTVGRAFANTR
jgi:hypothetical protein